MKRLLLVSVVVLTAFLAACGGTSTVTPSTIPSTTPSSTAMPGTPVAVAGGGTYWSITPAQLYGMLATKNFLLVDADLQYTGEIVGTDLFINSDNISQELDKFPADKTAEIVLYCASGVHSAEVAVVLVQVGYTRVMNLAGGLLAWQQQGYITVNNNRTMT